MSFAGEGSCVICAVRCGEALYGVRAVSICEVLEWQPVTHVPLAPDHVFGVVVYQGDVLTVLSLRSLLGAPRLITERAMVVTQDPATGERFILAVDSVEQVFSVPELEILQPPSALTGRMANVVTGLCRLAGELLVLLDVPALAPDRLMEEHDSGRGGRPEA